MLLVSTNTIIGFKDISKFSSKLQKRKNAGKLKETNREKVYSEDRNNNQFIYCICV